MNAVGNCKRIHLFKSTMTLGTKLMSITVALPTNAKHFITLLEDINTHAARLWLSWPQLPDGSCTVSDLGNSLVFWLHESSIRKPTI